MCFVAPFRLHAWDLAAATACVWGPPASYSHALTHCAVARSRSRRLAHRGAGDGLPKLLDQLPPGLREPTLDPARPGSGARPLRSRPPQPPRPDEGELGGLPASRRGGAGAQRAESSEIWEEMTREGSRPRETSLWCQPRALCGARFS